MRSAALVLIACVMIINIASAVTPTPTLPNGQILRITAEVGETYAQFNWKSDTGVAIPPVNILIDDSQTPTIYNYTSNTYLIDGLSDGTRHNIALYNATNWGSGNRQLLGKATTTTLKPAYEIYFLLAVTVAMMVLTIIMGNDLIRLVLLSIFNILICLFGITLATGRGAIPYLFIGIAIITALILVINGYSKFKDEVAFW